MYYFRKGSGLELDFCIRYKGACTPVEVKARTGNAKSPKSDIDIAAEGSRDFRGFEEDVRDHLDSLLVVDLVDLDTCRSEALRAEIARDGRA